MTADPMPWEAVRPEAPPGSDEALTARRRSSNVPCGIGYLTPARASGEEGNSLDRNHIVIRFYTFNRLHRIRAFRDGQRMAIRPTQNFAKFQGRCIALHYMVVVGCVYH